MATAKSPVGLNPVGLTEADKITAMVMAIREQVMSYYKGGCVEQLVNSNVSLQALYEGREPYQYQRREIERRYARGLLIGNVQCMTLRQSPDVLVMNMTTLGRSKQLKAVLEGVESFLDKYLQGVTIERVGEAPSKLVDDSDLLKAEPRDNTQSLHPYRAMDIGLNMVTEAMILQYDQLRGSDTTWTDVPL